MMLECSCERRGPVRPDPVSVTDGGMRRSLTVASIQQDRSAIQWGFRPNRSPMRRLTG